MHSSFLAFDCANASKCCQIKCFRFGDQSSPLFDAQEYKLLLLSDLCDWLWQFSSKCRNASGGAFGQWVLRQISDKFFKLTIYLSRYFGEKSCAKAYTDQRSCNLKIQLHKSYNVAILFFGVPSNVHSRKLIKIKFFLG